MLRELTADERFTPELILEQLEHDAMRVSGPRTDDESSRGSRNCIGDCPMTVAAARTRSTSASLLSRLQLLTTHVRDVVIRVSSDEADAGGGDMIAFSHAVFANAPCLG